MKIRTSLAVAACAAFSTYGVIFTSEPPHSAVAVPVGAVFTAVLIACLVISGGRRPVRPAAARAPQPSAAYRSPPREWHAVCDSEEALEWIRARHALGAASAQDVREVESELAEARRAWRRTGWHR